jgi:hypothetical protein
MRIISAHYAWNGKEGFVKNPLLYLNQQHEVVKLVGMGDNYTEHAHVEFFGGLLIPGFISNLLIGEHNTKSDVEYHLNIHFSKGSLYLTLSGNTQSIANPDNRTNPKVIESPSVLSFGLPWDQIRDEVKTGRENDIDKLLRTFLYQPWAENNMLDLGGSFEESTKPGVLLLNGINWSDMTFNTSLCLKIIHIPY